ncbi:hypothetical protein ACJX0J_030480, partial [Zea mays]
QVIIHKKNIEDMIRHNTMKMLKILLLGHKLGKLMGKVPTNGLSNHVFFLIFNIITLGYKYIHQASERAIGQYFLGVLSYLWASKEFQEKLIKKRIYQYLVITFVIIV